MHARRSLTWLNRVICMRGHCAFVWASQGPAQTLGSLIYSLTEVHDGPAAVFLRCGPGARGDEETGGKGLRVPRLPWACVARPRLLCAVWGLL